jgi:hypothetical protein
LWFSPDNGLNHQRSAHGAPLMKHFVERVRH